MQRAIDLGLSITWRDDVDDTELQQLFEWCDCAIYPSLEEGFGLPVAEKAFGTAVHA